MPRVELLDFALNIVSNSTNAYVWPVDDKVACTLISVVRKTDAAAVCNGELANSTNEWLVNVSVDNDWITESTVCTGQFIVGCICQWSPPKIVRAGMKKRRPCVRALLRKTPQPAYARLAQQVARDRRNVVE